MKVQSIIDMFENMTTSTSVNLTNPSVKPLERGNVHGLVTYYDGLAKAEEVVVSNSTVCRVRNESVVSQCELQLKEVKQEQKKEEKQQENSQQSIHESRKALAVTRPPSSIVLNLVSKIPQPKSREFHLAACSKRKNVSKDASSSRTCSDAMLQSFSVAPPTPVSVRARAPVASYAAFVARIEHSQSRLFDFEKDERWLEKMETMKGRVETLKRRNHIALAKEVASIPRKRRSLSECSGESTASTASMSSMDMLEVMYQ
ncbi:unnamed protein product [Peronospora farinosa]|uniref:Uncharacterized protein n=1 Tax=Peronospora farinosa TaxID=134698 RepID=A0AAV0UQ59_9STRA|nr:unnamed protein product [Peronospora farinosa]CAI5737421.1 unnamed protein product [Peronospora farinosa]